MRAPAPTVLFAALLATACQGPPTPAPAEIPVATPSGRVVAVLQRPVYDPAHALETCKPFHHVHAPDGRLLTKGQGGEYPHHRALFLGWNKLQWRGTSYDFWHCRNGEAQRCTAAAPAGADGWQRTEVDWCAGTGEVVLHERRELRARDVAADAVVLDVRTELRAASDPVHLDGDPQHAGHQFRALQQFAEKGATPVRYVRPATAEGGVDDVWTGCRWIAAVLPFADGEVTVLRIEADGNPGPTRWSTRPYGRFGATFTTDLVAGTPLELHWTYVVALGARDAAWCERTAAEQAATR